MYATLRRAKIVPGSAAEITRRVEAGFVPLVSGMSGFISFALIDGGDTMSTVTVFAERAMAERANEQAAAWVKANLGELLAGSLEMSVGAVAIQRNAADQ